MIDNQEKLQTKFKQAFRKMTVLGHDESELIDCSDVVRNLDESFASS